MKYLFSLFFLVVLFSCSSPNQQETTTMLPDEKQDTVGYVFSLDSIIVYGNMHLVGTEMMSIEEILSWTNVITSTQHWLYATVAEDIILIEGYPCDSIINAEYLKNYYKFLFQKDLTSKQLDSLEKFSSDYEVQMKFVLEGKKKVFGSEDKELYDAVIDTVTKNPELSGSDELLDLRSASMAENARLVSEFYKKRVAIIVGANHLRWFSANGYRVHYPPFLL